MPSKESLDIHFLEKSFVDLRYLILQNIVASDAKESMMKTAESISEKIMEKRRLYYLQQVDLEEKYFEQEMKGFVTGNPSLEIFMETENKMTLYLDRRGK